MKLSMRCPVSRLLPLIIGLVFITCFVGCGGGGGGGGNPAAVTVTTDQAVDLVSTTQNAQAALAKIRGRKLNSQDNTPWVIANSVFAFGADVDVEIVESNKSVKAVEYLCSEGKYQNQRVFRNQAGQPAIPTRDLSYGISESFKWQDHVDQFLSAFAEAGVATNQKIVADDGTVFNVGDMVNSSLRGFNPGQELAWTLVALTVYQGLEKPFVNDASQSYKISDLVALANLRDTSQEARWGAHHLYGVAFALQKHLQAGGQADGVWAEARAYLDRHIALAKKYQQADGAFSANMFSGSLAPDSPDLLLETTGHMLIWLNLALTPEQLKEAWVAKAVARLSQEIQNRELSAFGDSGMLMSGNALRRYTDLVSSGK